MYLGTINVIYNVPQINRKARFSCVFTWPSSVCNRQSPCAAHGGCWEVCARSSSMIHSHRRRCQDAVLNQVSCGNEAGAQLLSNASVHLEAFQRSHASFGGESVSNYAWRGGCRGCRQPSHVQVSWRIRSSHVWEEVWVICQLVHVKSIFFSIRQTASYKGLGFTAYNWLHRELNFCGF